MGWGGRATTDGNNAQIVPHGNCRNTPIEVLETRYPWIHEEYRLNDDGGGAGRTRGGPRDHPGADRRTPTRSSSTRSPTARASSRGACSADCPAQCGAFLVRKARRGRLAVLLAGVRHAERHEVLERAAAPRRPGRAADALGRRVRPAVGASRRIGRRGRRRGLRHGGGRRASATASCCRDGAVDAEATAARRLELAS